jgi:hypothetical protein
MGTETQEQRAQNTEPRLADKKFSSFLRVLIRWGFTFKELEFIICNDAKSLINNPGQSWNR